MFPDMWESMEHSRAGSAPFFLVHKAARQLLVDCTTILPQAFRAINATARKYGQEELQRLKDFACVETMGSYSPSSLTTALFISRLIYHPRPTSKYAPPPKRDLPKMPKLVPRVLSTASFSFIFHHLRVSCITALDGPIPGRFQDYAPSLHTLAHHRTSSYQR